MMQLIARHKLLLLLVSLAILGTFVLGITTLFDLAHLPTEKVTSRNSYVILAFVHSASLLAFFSLRQRSTRYTHNQILWLFISFIFLSALILIVMRLDYSTRVLLVGLPLSALLLLRHQSDIGKNDDARLFIAKDSKLEHQLARLGLHATSLGDDAIGTDTNAGLLLLPETTNKTDYYRFILGFDKPLNKRVMLGDQFIRDYQGRLDNLSLNDIAEHAKTNIYYSPFKRFWEIIITLFLLSLLSPIFIAAYLFIKSVSKGPAIFTQDRVGLDCKIFTIFKFRTMHLDSEASGAQFATKDDPRIIKFGAFLRKSRIDELPQLWNVLRGDMSLIGPRPEQKDLFDNLCQEIPQFALRQLTRPGITGWAQVVQGYADDEDSSRIKLSHDLYYIKHSGPTLDILIITRTLTTILTGFGSR